jgi:hypothetical protein
MFAESPPKNYGFMLRLDEEIIFNAVYLASSNNADLSRRPQLWITYDDGLVGAGSSGLSASGVHFSVAPNPSSGVFSVTMEGDFSAEKYEAEVFDLQGKTLLKQPLTGSFSYLYANRLPAGTYLLQIRGDGGYVQQTKIVLTK